jgi:hypothetical protein
LPANGTSTLLLTRNYTRRSDAPIEIRGKALGAYPLLVRNFVVVRNVIK